jgi:hypothetical protein
MQKRMKKNPQNDSQFSHLETSASERFSSCDLAGLKDVNGLGQLAGEPGAAAEFAQDVPGLQRRAAFARGP